MLRVGRDVCIELFLGNSFLMQHNENHTDDPAPNDVAEEELTTAEFLSWLEFGCWTMLVLAPLLYYVNGPSVSTDQFVVRTGLVVLSTLGAFALRLINRRRLKLENNENR